MKRLSPVFLLAVAAASVSWSQPSTDHPKGVLSQRGIVYTDDTFAKYVKEGNSEVVELFLAAGADPNGLSRDGELLVVVAARAGREEVAALLLSAGAGSEALVRLAVEDRSGFDWNAVTERISDLSGIMIALVGLLFTHLYNQRGKRLQELETVQKLISPLTGGEDERAAALVSIAHLATPDLAASLAGLKPDKGSAVACIELLRGGKLKDLRPLRSTLGYVFLGAVRKGESEIVKLLREQLSPDDWDRLLKITDHEDRTCAMLAARNDHADLFSMLVVDERASLEPVDEDGKTVLHLAAKHGHKGPVQTILEVINKWPPEKRKLYLDTTDEVGRTAVDRATERKHIEIQNSLTQAMEKDA